MVPKRRVTEGVLRLLLARPGAIPLNRLFEGLGIHECQGFILSVNGFDAVEHALDVADTLTGPTHGVLIDFGSVLGWLGHGSFLRHRFHGCVLGRRGEQESLQTGCHILNNTVSLLSLIMLQLLFLQQDAVPFCLLLSPLLQGEAFAFHGGGLGLLLADVGAVKAFLGLDFLLLEHLGAVALELVEEAGLAGVDDHEILKGEHLVGFHLDLELGLQVLDQHQVLLPVPLNFGQRLLLKLNHHLGTSVGLLLAEQLYLAVEVDAVVIVLVRILTHILLQLFQVQNRLFPVPLERRVHKVQQLGCLRQQGVLAFELRNRLASFFARERLSADDGIRGPFLHLDQGVLAKYLV